MKVKAVHIAGERWERILGWVLFLAGCYLLWAAYSGRGKSAPWFTAPILPIP